MASAGAGLVVLSGLVYGGMNDVPAESCIVLGVLTYIGRDFDFVFSQ